MASMLDQLGNDQSNCSWISDVASARDKMNQNEEQQKSLFGGYSISKAQVSDEKIKPEG
mgnify:CR=1 FL=1